MKFEQTLKCLIIICWWKTAEIHKCSCGSQQSCKTTRYGYSTTSIPCIEFCPCEAVTGVCCNEQTFLTNANDRKKIKVVFNKNMSESFSHLDNYINVPF